MRVRSHDPLSLQSLHFDIIIVGAGCVGSALAYGLGNTGRKVLLIERDLSPPDRIVGELLQPGGCASLDTLGMLDCLDNIDARLVRGYQVYWGDKSVATPYPSCAEPLPWHEEGLSNREHQSDRDKTHFQGRSFHHGRFIDNLRKKAVTCPNVYLMEGTVVDLITDDELITGVEVIPSSKAVYTTEHPVLTSKEPLSFHASLSIVADGYASKFRKQLSPSARPPIVRSNFVSLLLKDASLPAPAHGHVILRNTVPGIVVDKAGPILVYQLSEHDTRMLVDVPGVKLPSIGNGDLKRHMERNVRPHLPSQLVPSFTAALESTDPEDRLRSMPNSFLPAHPQHREVSSEGCLLIGDALNMRHPLTGGGMTVGLGDAVILTELLGLENNEDPIDLQNEQWRVREAAESWFWRRKGLTGTINVLAQALYSLFAAEDEDLDILKIACFKYFEKGGRCVSDPVSMLAGIRPSPALLFYHFFSVAFYAIYILFTLPQPGHKDSPSFLDWPYLFMRSLSVIWTACLVFLPVIMTEIRA